MPADKPDPQPRIFFEPDFLSDEDEEGPRAALERTGVELARPNPDLDAIREWLCGPGAGFNRRFMVSMMIDRYQQAAVGKPSAEDLRILRALHEGLLHPASFSIARIRELARELPESRLASSDPGERAAGERLREKIR